MGTRNNDEYQTAIHEAGHAVMGFYKGLKIRTVTIIPNSDALGCMESASMFSRVRLDIVSPNDPKFERYFYRGIRSAMIDFAGPFSEQECLGIKKIKNGQNDSDFLSGGTMLQRFAATDEQFGKLWDYVEVCTQDFLKAPNMRKSMFALADVLMERKKMNGGEVEALLCEVAYAKRPQL